MNLAVKILVAAGSGVSLGFGIWHFFVPGIWKWYSYIDDAAAELVLAVRAINAFFSVSLILFALMNVLLVFGNRSNKYSMTVVLGATSLLWFLRTALQLVSPQGSISRLLQYGMLSAFVFVFICYASALALILTRP